MQESTPRQTNSCWCIPVLCPLAPQLTLLFREIPKNVAAFCNPVLSTMIGLGLLEGTPSFNPFSIPLWTCGSMIKQPDLKPLKKLKSSGGSPGKLLWPVSTVGCRFNPGAAGAGCSGAATATVLPWECAAPAPRRLRSAVHRDTSILNIVC